MWKLKVATYNRTLAEFKAPFGQGMAAGALELESASLVALDDPYWNAYQEDGDAARYANSYADSFRAAYGPSLFGVLDADRTAEARQQVANAFYAKLRAKISAAPQLASTHWRVVLLLIARKADSV